MGFLNRIFGKKNRKQTDRTEASIISVNTKERGIENTKNIYLNGWEADFNGDEQCQAFIMTQRTTEINAKSAYAAIELVFENDLLVKAFDYEEGYRNIRSLSEEEIGLKYIDYPINPILKYFDNENGLHQLGGKLPDDIHFPDNNCQVPFQYLGYISHKDQNFNWLPSTIHLMCPIYLNIDKVYLDYTNPEKPVLINRKEVEAIDTSYDDLNQETKIEFNSKKFDLIPFDSIEPPMHAGLPDWIQYPTFPKCPKSGRTMRFLCQMNGGVDASYSNVTPKKESYRAYFEKLNFWIDGDMYVFIEPEEKTVCYFIQNT